MSILPESSFVGEVSDVWCWTCRVNMSLGGRTVFDQFVAQGLARIGNLHALRVEAIAIRLRIFCVFFESL